MAPSTTVLDIRRSNRGRVLRHVLLSGETTRARLAQQTNLSIATINNVVADLIGEGLVQEVGTVPSHGGRPISLLSARSETAYFVGADVGEHGVTVELFDLSMQRIDRVFDQVPSRSAKPETIGATLRNAIAAIRESNAEIEERILGIGLGLPGIVDGTSSDHATIHAQSLGWDPVRLQDLYEDHSIAVFADNGAKTLATAEAWRGAAKDVNRCVVALVGRGLGAGFIVEGTLIRGQSGSAGEWGHTKISLDGRPCACGGRGCLEAYVGGGAIMQRWQEAGGAPSGTEEEALTQLVGAAESGDRDAEKVLDETLEILGVGLANLVNLLNPESIIIGGWTGLALADARLPQLAEHMRVNALRRPAEQVRLEVSQVGPDAVALGAALLPLQELIDGTISVPQPAS